MPIRSRCRRSGAGSVEGDESTVGDVFPQSRSGGAGGMQTVGYEGEQLVAGVGVAVGVDVVDGGTVGVAVRVGVSVVVRVGSGVGGSVGVDENNR